MSQQDINEKLKNAVTELQKVTPTFVPADPEVMTIVAEWPPGDSGLPPHRHPGGPCFGYVLEGEMVFELAGQPPRVVKAGEAFWEPGGDVVHYRAANNLTDAETQFVAVMFCRPGEPMLTLLTPEEIAERRSRRHPAGRP